MDVILWNCDVSSIMIGRFWPIRDSVPLQEKTTDAHAFTTWPEMQLAIDQKAPKSPFQATAKNPEYNPTWQQQKKNSGEILKNHITAWLYSEVKHINGHPLEHGDNEYFPAFLTKYSQDSWVINKLYLPLVRNKHITHLLVWMSSMNFYAFLLFAFYLSLHMIRNLICTIKCHKL